MISEVVRRQYTATIGIECHVQLKTETKLFAAVGNDARSAPPNSLVSHICFGLPGALPVLNEEALRLATRAAFALGTKPERFSKFDRKHYFYPDLPKGYQISQYDEPIIGKGEITIEVDGKPKKVGITRAHLEEDAGKSTHPAGTDYSLVDLNRAGTPLLEIVSEPDMHTSAEAKAYARELYLRMRYAEVSDANLYYGNMRFDVNVSVSKTDELGSRTETKNLNSFRSVEKAVDYEIKRQIEQLEGGKRIIQETRGWDDAKQATFSQRSKENADDYRYMPDPDLPPIVLEDEYISRIGEDMPIMPNQIRDQMQSAGIDKMVAESIIEQPPLARLWEKICQSGASLAAQKRIADWFSSVILRQLNDSPHIDLEASIQNEPSFLNPEGLVKLSDLVEANEINGSAAKEFLLKFWTDLHDVHAQAKEAGIIQVSDEGEIAKIVEQVLADNPKAIEDVKNGEMKAIGFLVGQVMKASQGQANPSLAQKLIKQKLGL